MHAAKRCVIDWYATTLPSAVEAPASMLEKALADELDHGEVGVARLWSLEREPDLAFTRTLRA